MNRTILHYNHMVNYFSTGNNGTMVQKAAGERIFDHFSVFRLWGHMVYPLSEDRIENSYLGERICYGLN